MNDKERVPVSFWLKDKTVTGLLVADHAGKKLVSYSGKYFVVSGKTPEKRHYTESTLPASWKKIVTGGAPPSPTAPKAAKAAGKATPVPAEKAALATPQEVDVPGKQAVRVRKKRGEEAPLEPAKAAKAPGKEGKQKRPAKPQTTEKETVPYLCPYCSTEHSCSADQAGTPFFQQCLKCGKDFGVKITARMIYQAEVAAFK